MTDQFKHGDRVYITDPALAQMREIMRNATGEEPTPNHHGTVEEVWDDGCILIYFDDGVGAPYPADEVRHLDPAPGSLEYAQQQAEAARDLDDETEEETR